MMKRRIMEPFLEGKVRACKHGKRVRGSVSCDDLTVCDVIRMMTKTLLVKPKKNDKKSNEDDDDYGAEDEEEVQVRCWRSFWEGGNPSVVTHCCAIKIKCKHARRVRKRKSGKA